MGRVAQNFSIPASTYCTMVSKLEKPIYDQMKVLAHQKGLSTHKLIEIVLERYIKEQK